MRTWVYQMCLIVLIAAYFPSLAAGEETVEVFRHDGSRQSEAGSGIDLKEMANQLKSADIRILSSRKGSDGRMYPMVCGGATGVINIYMISEHQLQAAQDLGFSLLRQF